MEKTFTLEQFKELLKNPDWKHETLIEPQETREECGKDGQDHDHTWGYVTNVSTLDGLKIEFTESFEYFHFEPDTFKYGPNGEEPRVRIEGFEVVDEDGEELDGYDLDEYVDDNLNFSCYDDDGPGVYEDLYTEVEVGDGEETESIERDYRPTLVAHYDGYQKVSSYWYDAVNWETVKLYGLKDGVIVQYGFDSRFVGNTPKSDAEVFTGEDYKAKAIAWVRAKLEDRRHPDRELEEKAVKAIEENF